MNTADVERILVQTLDRVSMMLGALFASSLGDISPDMKAERLSRCGFSNVQVAKILGMTANAVNVGLHRARHGTGSAPRRKTPAKTPHLPLTPKR